MRRRSRYRPGQFRPGFDPRRHVFTREECSRGGRVSFVRFMAAFRLEAGWPLFTEQLLEEGRREYRRRVAEGRALSPKAIAMAEAQGVT